jgi:hypothetical protein
MRLAEDSDASIRVDNAGRIRAERDMLLGAQEIEAGGASLSIKQPGNDSTFVLMGSKPCTASDKDSVWAGLDSNQGPADYESAALDH